ncbi:MAG: EamA family transporter [Spirochaetales bacterium]|nr:EamA family transporter [Spirochaetales bacterium]
MVIIYALLSAAAYGTADFMGGFSSRKNAVTTTAIWTQLTGLIMAAIAALILGSTNVGLVDILWGIASGFSGVTGLLILYKGLSCGKVSIVSPSAALAGAIIPVIFGLLIGERPPILTWIGIAFSIPAIIFLSWEKGEKEDHTIKSLQYGLLAGTFFGGFFILLSQTSETSGMWPLAAAKFGSLLLSFSILLFRKNKICLEKGTRKLTILSGIIDMAANIFYLLASRTGYLIIAVVLSALYPAPTVILQRLFIHEKLTFIRIVGIILSITGAALIGIGG